MGLRPEPRRTPVARAMLCCLVMKDILFIALPLAFFWVSWVYAKSFERL